MQTDNRRDFDAVAEQWDQEPRRLKLAQDVVAALRKALPLTSNMAALDYGCGSGLVTLGLQPFVGRITGADSSQGMLDVLDKKIQAEALLNVSTLLLDLEQQRLEGSFDLIVSSMTLHHVQDVPSLIATLAKALKPGGWLALADLESEDGRFHDDPTGVLHHGFSREFLTGEFAANGLADVAVVTAAAIDKPGADGTPRRYPVLLCVGHK
ncbi:class I SAM-dependent methyltransferase [Geomonas oryzisoli]|uniref:Class I SAM-dependent methyltransferase n=1 Tax=Geomonas oryzisoli TaxID=2847992 RepID=A0ABX8J839_9BACT|nr:class I SAM-dependent methyltransferase [Geomonas oryzisoli]QWV94191.1 class I SAM-dependent methyltransferase [Geomonas oryzisoli]